MAACLIGMSIGNHSIMVRSESACLTDVELLVKPSLPVSVLGVGEPAVLVVVWAVVGAGPVSAVVTWSSSVRGLLFVTNCV